MHIIRGYVVPKRVGEEFVRGEEISSDEAVKFFDEFKQFIRVALMNYTKIMGQKLKTAKDVNNFLNYLVLLIRSNFYVDTIKDVIPSVATAVPSYLLEELYKKGVSQPNVYDYFKYLESYKPTVAQDIFELIKFPADTRPAANTSSLLLHLLVISGLASCHYLSRENDLRISSRDKDLALLRLTCLFHDVGKMEDWVKHEKISRAILWELLKDEEYVELQSEAFNIVDIASRYIVKEEEAYEFKKLKDLYVKADIEASASDRLLKTLTLLLPENEKKLIYDKAKEHLNQEKIAPIDLEKCYNDYRFWVKFSKEEIKLLTESFCREAAKIDPNNPLLVVKEEDKFESSLDVEVARFDVRGIQSLIQVNDLRTMAGGSQLVDYVVFAGLPLKLILEYDVPAEAILYYGGGNLTTLLPTGWLNKVMEGKNEIKIEGVNVVVGSAKWTPAFQQLNFMIERNLFAKKTSLNPKDSSNWLELNIFKLCPLCTKGYASKKKVEEDYVCEECSKQREIGDSFHFSFKLKKLGLKEEDKFLKYVLEFIGGSPVEEVKEGQFKIYRNIAVLRFDANLAGPFMGSAVNITDAFERSIRIDRSLKNSYQNFLDTLNKFNHEDYQRLVLGTIYIGGDDGFIIVPSKLAFHTAVYLLNEFYLDMGGFLTLSCGIAVAKPKHPIIQLYESAGELLDGAKGSVRQSVYTSIYSKGGAERPSGDLRGALRFYMSERGFLIKEGINTAFQQLSEKGLTYQEKGAFILASRTNKTSILKLYDIFTTTSIQLQSLRANLEESLKHLMSNEEKENIKDRLSMCKETLSIEVQGDSSTTLRILYGMRQEARKMGDETLSKLLRMISYENGRLILPLADIITFGQVIYGE
ncbi:MAG: hypothetical protein QW282_07310 [Nitrososphaerales archaeon]